MVGFTSYYGCSFCRPIATSDSQMGSIDPTSNGCSQVFTAHPKLSGVYSLAWGGLIYGYGWAYLNIYCNGNLFTRNTWQAPYESNPNCAAECFSNSGMHQLHLNEGDVICFQNSIGDRGNYIACTPTYVFMKELN